MGGEALVLGSVCRAEVDSSVKVLGMAGKNVSHGKSVCTQPTTKGRGVRRSSKSKKHTHSTHATHHHTCEQHALAVGMGERLFVQHSTANHIHMLNGFGQR